MEFRRSPEARAPAKIIKKMLQKKDAVSVF
jgi:hypothetical protein